ncbi:hypothetical protein ACHQM5_009958 [Ranunculus cassubicifolius]
MSQEISSNPDRQSLTLTSEIRESKHKSELPSTTTITATTTKNVTGEPTAKASGLLELSGREKLKRHRMDMAGRVWIPDAWGQEEFLHSWTDCSAFDASLGRAKILSARAALMEEGRRVHSDGMRFGN